MCSGGTGRNGGHIKETPYLEWSTLVERFGRVAADEVIRFRMAHLQQVLGVADREELRKSSDAREVESLDVYCESKSWLAAKDALRAWLEAFPDETDKWRVWEGDEVRTVSCDLRYWRRASN